MSAFASTAITAAIEKSINHALKFDPASRDQLFSLSGRTVQIICQSPNVEFFFRIHDDCVNVNTYFEGEADVIISGSASDFLSLVGESSHSLADSNISVSGKVSILNQVKAALANLDIDWEDMLSDVVGVIPANIGATLFRNTTDWLNQQKSSFEEHLPEYLSEELRAVPSSSELNAFYEGVDEVKSSAQRLHARVQQLARRVKNAHDNQPISDSKSS